MSTRNQLKPTGVPCLYRHEQNKNYYGVKKHRGTILNKALRTGNGDKITDRKLAEAALRNWIDSLDAPEAKDMPTFRELYEMFLKAKGGKAGSTHKSYTFRFKTIETEAPAIMDMPIDKIKPSDFAQMLGKLEKSWMPRTFNALTLFIKMMFDLAIQDELIEKNPYTRLSTKRLRLKDKPAEVPTIEQCEAIARSIREQEFSDTAEDSADKVSFLHLAALGEAEADFLIWNDVKFEDGFMQCKRIKTGAYFPVPLYPDLRDFMLNLYVRQGEPDPEEKIFKIRSIKKGLSNACKRLGLKQYSPRDLRKARIVWMLRRDIKPETLARWQGHKDNGVLIRRTYSWVLDDDLKNYEKTQIALLSGKREPRKDVVL